jgi:dTMP kinase
LKWCTSSDRGLPSPDLVIYLDVLPTVQEQRSQWGEERFEHTEMQRKARLNFLELAQTNTWNLFNADRNKDELHRDILDRVLGVVRDCKNKPISLLYESDL